MAILNRVSNILRANINDMLDHAEDPEKMLNQICRDMAQAIQEAKAQVTETIAQENLLKSNLENARNMAAQWQEKAELAVEKGRDDLAREALHRKRDFEGNAQVYETQLASQHQMVDKLKADLQALEEKYEDLLRNREVLIARHKMAEAQRKIQTTVSAASAVDYTSDLNRMEEKIRLEEARAAASAEMAGATLDAQFDALTSGQKDSAVDDELQALKEKKGKA
ncbi:MAG: PspA/IM30 family protein [Bacteroidetes bacterium]|nr:PspA/IM30 family protein [Bacteroidota bacterium]MCL5026963.1 PspA/IM30 family protein [Chloroflexota bacterium]